jgi:hypothetical protein
MKKKYHARKIETAIGCWWGVFMETDNADYPNGVLVATICNHHEFFEPEKIAKRIVCFLNNDGSE